MSASSATSFFYRIANHAANQPAKPAFVAEFDVTYGQLSNRIAFGVDQLRSAGLTAGSIVGLSIADEVEHMIACLSLLALGCRQITLATFDPAPLQLKLASRIGVTHRLTHNAEPMAGLQPVFWSPKGGAGEAPPVDLPDSGSLFLKTSGTTGEGNLVEYSQAQLAGHALRHADEASDRFLRLASVEHNNSKRHRLYCLYVGGTNVFSTDPSVPAGAFCRVKGVTCLDISTLHAADLVQEAKAATRPLLGNVRVRTGGSGVPSRLRKELMEMVSLSLFVRYGATECGTIAAAGPAQHQGEGSAGRPVDGVVVEIVDETDRQVAPGALGEVRLKTPGMATGYVDNAEETQRRFRQGWFYPGDVGHLDADGVLFIHGRKDDMMILNGINISPFEVERALELHPAVKAAAALPVHSGVHGQIPVAAVELHDGAVVTVVELQRFAREHLALRAPRRVIILPTLPRNAQGKLLKREIAELFKPSRDIHE